MTVLLPDLRCQHCGALPNIARHAHARWCAYGLTPTYVVPAPTSSRADVVRCPTCGSINHHHSRYCRNQRTDSR